jgi:hypothetical protein
MLVSMKPLDNQSLNEAVQALADRQLSWEEEKFIRAQIENDPVIREQYERITHQNKLLRQWWQSLSSSHS